MALLPHCINFKLSYFLPSIPHSPRWGCIYFIICWLAVVNCLRERSFEDYYTSATIFYQNNNWYGCYTESKQALFSLKSYRHAVAGCRKLCQEQFKVEATPLAYLSFAETAIYRSDCQRKCVSANNVSHRRNQPTILQSEEEELKLYNYLQICAYKVNKVEDAVSAAYTYFIARPDDELMQSNMDFYRRMPEVEAKFFVNLKRPDYQELYNRGVDLYNAGEYLLVTVEIERALQLFYSEAEKCRLLCEDSFDHQSLPELYSAMADHWVEVLKCRRKCEDIMTSFDGEPFPNVLREMYNYLQFSYYKIGDLTGAARACGSFLELDPEDEQMLNNRRYYTESLSVDEGDFRPHQVAVEYAYQLRLEARLRDFVNTEYTFSDAELDASGKDIKAPMKKELFRNPYDDLPTASPLLRDPLLPHLPLGERTAEFVASLAEYVEGAGLQMQQEAEQLGGTTRVAVDNVLSEEECQALVKLAQTAGTVGDGYRNQEAGTSPHTDYEMFKGVTVAKATQMVIAGELDADSLDTYLRASEASRAFVEKYNNLQTPLHFHYTHLVCRTALQDHEGRGEELSHPILGDNCILLGDGTCLKQPPAYTSRDFTSLLYLNSDFQGGDFFFAHKNQTPQVLLRPQCGRLVAFESSTLHGVQAVSEGERCALALWYTLDSTQSEQAQRDARLVLRGLQSKAKPLENPTLRQLVEDKQYSIVLTESELNGPERFAADHVISEQRCQALIDLVVKSAVQNDGYSHKGALESPQSKHEDYHGLTLNTAAELAEKRSISAEQMYEFMRSSREAMRLVEAYFNLSTPLYFDYTHLVCRTATNSNNKDRKDLSHAIHSDNCLIHPDGTCHKVRPAYIQRDYSALLYLNADFEGGQFIFTNKDFSVQSRVKPQCGRLVGFNASNYHGVEAVLSGKRCALAMWYTLDPNFSEVAQQQADRTLAKLKFTPPPEDGEGRRGDTGEKDEL